MSKVYVVFRDKSLAKPRYSGNVPKGIEPLNVTMSETGLDMLVKQGHTVHVLDFDETGALVDDMREEESGGK